jgi:hypothetical protein
MFLKNIFYLFIILKLWGGGISKTDADAAYIDQKELQDYLTNQKYAQQSALSNYVLNEDFTKTIANNATIKALEQAGVVTKDKYFNLTTEQVNDYFKNNKNKDISGMFYGIDNNWPALGLISNDKFVAVGGNGPQIILSKGEQDLRESIGIRPYGLFIEGPKKTGLGIRLNDTEPIYIENTYGSYRAGPQGIRFNDWSISPDETSTKLCFKNSKTNFNYCLGSSANQTLPASYIRRRY